MWEFSTKRNNKGSSDSSDKKGSSCTPRGILRFGPALKQLGLEKSFKEMKLAVQSKQVVFTFKGSN